MTLNSDNTSLKQTQFSTGKSIENRLTNLYNTTGLLRNTKREMYMNYTYIL